MHCSLCGRGAGYLYDLWKVGDEYHCLKCVEERYLEFCASEKELEEQGESEQNEREREVVD